MISETTLLPLLNGAPPPYHAEAAPNPPLPVLQEIQGAPGMYTVTVTVGGIMHLMQIDLSRVVHFAHQGNFEGDGTQ